ncbi:Glycosylphosphatidylinositol anchor attachment 1 protein [Armadillidium vulgare]|nr:Glycosylphosphatidylinositol anchor attachment 1 protein [Armadillidium vulgare]
MGDSVAHFYLKALEEEAERHPNAVPYSWLLAQFTQIGLDTHSHNFTLHYPLGNKVFQGVNIYGILRAVRGSSTESLVVSTPYRPPTSVHQKTTASIALMLALAKFFSEQVYWAKDIIFLITEHEQLGAQAWLEAYHRSSCGSGVLDSGDLTARAGPIQAAVNLEIGSSLISHIDVKIEGLNGQLPNLDLVNLIHRLCHRENVHHTFKNYDDHVAPETVKGWMHQLRTLFSMVATQASGVPNGNHGLYHRFGIASVTVEGVKEHGRTRRSANLLQVGRVLEGICRSLNNLLERFHQSFFFYLLPATNRYISIGVYMPPFGCLGGSLLTIALALWYHTSCAANEQLKTMKKGEECETQLVDYSILGQSAIIVLAHALGLTLLFSIEKIPVFSQLFGLLAEDALLLSLVAYSVCLLSLPLLVNRATSLSQNSWEILKCLVVLELSVVVFAGFVYNFSFGINCDLDICTSRDDHSSFKKFDLEVDVLAKKSISATKRALMYSVVDAHVYGNWVFSLGALCLMPIWFILWFIVWHPVNNSKSNSDVKSKTS